MTETAEQVQLRKHLAEMRRAAGGVGKDFEIAFKNLDNEIGRLGTAAGKDFKYSYAEIQDDFLRLGRSIDDELARLPHQVKEGAVSFASAVGSGASRAGAPPATRSSTLGSRAKEGTKNALASAAGVNRKPMKEWHPTGSSGSSSGDSE